MLKAIMAISKDGKVGSNQTNSGLPWEHGTYPEDMKYFRKATKSSIVIMGNNTYKTLGDASGLKGRTNWVLSSEVPEMCKLGYRTITDTCCKASKNFIKAFAPLCKQWNNVWFIGGVSVYEQFIDDIDEFHITRVEDSYPDADVSFDVDKVLDTKCFRLISSETLSDKCKLEVWSKS